MNLRKTLLDLHRDLGYLAVGATVVYAISGFVVNHREDWDFNYITERTVTTVGTPATLLGGEHGDPAPEPGALARAREQELVAALVRTLGREESPRRVFWRAADRMSMFFGFGDRDIVDYLPAVGVVEHDQRRPIPLIRQLNFLHLNEGRRFWTYLADVYAFTLVFMAISGAFIVRGRRGLKGRGGVLMLAGVLLPLLSYLLLS